MIAKNRTTGEAEIGFARFSFLLVFIEKWSFPNIYK